jgi:hypothetical protein
MRNFFSRCLVLVLATIATAHAADDAQALASKLAAAYKAGNIDAALALFNTKNPQAIIEVYVDSVSDCFEDNLKDYRCTVTAAPTPDEVVQGIAQHAIDSQPAPEGVIYVTKKSSTSKPYEHTLAFPYAKVDGKFVITGFQMDAQKLAELKAATAQSVTDKLLAVGPYVPLPRDPTWKRRASVLPAGGGDAGAALVTRTNAMAAALKANDVDAMIAAEGGGAKYRYPAIKDGKPVSLHQRQLNMRSHMNYSLVDVNVLGGYQLDDHAVLMIEGHEGTGWIARGWQAMIHREGKWEVGGEERVAIPPT